MPRSGTLLICTQNLDFSGANQVVLNIVSGTMHEGNVVILSPISGPMAIRFVECGAAVRTGDLLDILVSIRDVFCVICNTIMTAAVIVEMAKRPISTIWILHEWWDDSMIVENLSMRNLSGLNVETVKEAMMKASKVVCVCEGQRKLYCPPAPSTVIYVGVPRPIAKLAINHGYKDREGCLTLLVLGIICPRKNQVWAVQLFKKFAMGRSDCKLLVVGARYTRDYEIRYLEQVRAEIGDDPRISLHDVTEDVDSFYDNTDILLFTSTNEVTPLVISEAMSRGIPVVSTNIAGIPEMITHGVEGFLVDVGDDESALKYMRLLASEDGDSLRARMGASGVARFDRMFDLNIMIDSYRRLIYEVAPPIVLVDMDGTLVDWDRGFMEAWKDRCPVHRDQSYFIERCVHSEHCREAELLYHAQGFFEGLPPMDGALAALKEMVSDGLRVYVCSTPVLTSLYCAQEKINWVRVYLGECWLDKLILCADKTIIKGDLLIDDKPMDLMAPCGRHTAAIWKQVVFDAPYNRGVSIPRISAWREWRSVVQPLLGKRANEDPYRLQYGQPSPALLSPTFRSSQEEAVEAAGLVCSLHDSGEPNSFTLTDDSESFTEDFRGMCDDNLKTQWGTGNNESIVSSCVKEKALLLVRRDRRIAIEQGSEDIIDVELFRECYRRWRTKNMTPYAHG